MVTLTILFVLPLGFMAIHWRTGLGMTHGFIIYALLLVYPHSHWIWDLLLPFLHLPGDSSCPGSLQTHCSQGWPWTPHPSAFTAPALSYRIYYAWLVCGRWFEPRSWCEVNKCSTNWTLGWVLGWPGTLWCGWFHGEGRECECEWVRIAVVSLQALLGHQLCSSTF